MVIRSLFVFFWKGAGYARPGFVPDSWDYSLCGVLIELLFLKTVS
jgi:hypothetical protein